MTDQYHIFVPFHSGVSAKKRPIEIEGQGQGREGYPRVWCRGLRIAAACGAAGTPKWRNQLQQDMMVFAYLSALVATRVLSNNDSSHIITPPKL